MLHAQSPAARRLAAMGSNVPAKGYRNGGLIDGPGDGTSDSIDIKASKGEFMLPADTTRKVGVKRLNDLIERTHAPSGRAKKAGHYADGGLVTDDDERRRNSFGDAAAAAQNPNVQQIAAPPAPSPAAPAPTAAAAALAPSSVGQPAGNALANQIPMDTDKQAPKPDGSMDNVFNTDTGRNLQAIASSVGGLGGALPAVAKTGGVISSLLSRGLSSVEGASAATIGAASTPAMAGMIPWPGESKPLASNPESSGRVIPEPTANATPPSAAQVAPPSNWDRSGMTNAQVGQANPDGRVRMERLADGSTSFSGGNVSGPVSYTNERGSAVEGAGMRGDGFGGFRVSPGGAQVSLGPNGSYVYPSDAGQPTAGAATTPSSAQPGGQQAARSTEAAAGAQSATQRSPVGMTVDQAQREGLVGQRVGYNPAFDQRLQGGAPGQAGQTETPQFVEPQVANSTNDYSARKRLENLATSASSITNTTKWGGRGAENNPTARAYRAALDNDLALQSEQPRAAQATLQANAGLQREGIQQAGANQREGMRTSVDRGRLALEQMAAAERSRGAARLEAAQEAVAQADTPEKQRSAQSRLLALMGKPESTKDRFVTAGGGTYVQDGQTVKDPVTIYDSVTQQWLRPPSSSQPNTPPAKDKLVNGKIYNLPDGRSMRWNGSGFVPVN